MRYVILRWKSWKSSRGFQETKRTWKAVEMELKCKNILGFASFQPPLANWLGLESLGRFMVRFDGRAPSERHDITAEWPWELTVKRISLPEISSCVGNDSAFGFGDLEPEKLERSPRSPSGVFKPGNLIFPFPGWESSGQVWRRQFEIPLSDSPSLPSPLAPLSWFWSSTFSMTSTVSARCRGGTSRGRRGVPAGVLGVIGIPSCMGSTCVATVVMAGPTADIAFSATATTTTTTTTSTTTSTCLFSEEDKEVTILWNCGRKHLLLDSWMYDTDWNAKTEKRMDVQKKAPHLSECWYQWCLHQEYLEILPRSSTHLESPARTRANVTF